MRVHENIIAYSAVFEENGCMYVQMDFHPNGNLREWIAAQQPSDVGDPNDLRPDMGVLLGGVAYVPYEYLDTDSRPRRGWR